MTNLRFFKVVGSGNDFILVDQRRRSPLANPSLVAKAWCDRKQGIGADGLLVLLPSAKADARMRIFNPDGSEAEMCGNGLRCLAWFLHTQNRRKTLSIETRAGLMQAQIVGPGQVRTYLVHPKKLRLGLSLRHRGKRYQVHAVNTGVPHAVLLVSHLERMDLVSLGPAIRFHRAFRPAGTNVDLVRIDSPHRISIRTYERGVEAETLACGTGAVASTVIGTALGKLQPPVRVMTTGGEYLTVGFHQKRRPWEELYLEGPAQILFGGGMPL